MEISNQVRSHYQEYYSGGADAEWRRLGAIDKVENILRAWRTISRAKPSVVELGCGDGAIAARLAEIDFFENYRGFDISTSGIEYARSRSIPKADFSVCTDAIPVKENSADLVIMSHVIEHLEHPRALIGEAHRIAPILIAEVPLELNRGLPEDYDWDPVGHINKYDRVTIRQLIQTCHFEVVEQFSTNPSRLVATFKNSQLQGNVKWAVKQFLLTAAPNFARGRFTYHETIVARRATPHPSSGIESAEGCP